MSKVVIVGAGLIGMLTARELVNAGLEVILLDKSRAGTESSWAGGGILSPLYPWRYPEPVLQLAGIGHEGYESLARSLQDESGLDPEWTRSGMLILDENETVASEQWSSRSGIHCEEITLPLLKQTEPSLADAYQQALWLPDVAQIRNPRLVKTVKQSILSLGVTLIESVEVESMLFESGVVTGVKTQDEIVTADKVVITGGAWSAGLLPSMGSEIKVEPVRGQMILFKTKPGLINRIILSQGRYLIPRRDGHVLMGSTMEKVGFDKSTTAEAMNDLKAAAYDIIPELRDCDIVKHWSGLRPSSPTGVPYIGEHPDISGLFVNAGHYRNGVILAPASCKLLADIMLDQPTDLDPSPFSLKTAH